MTKRFMVAVGLFVVAIVLVSVTLVSRFAGEEVEGWPSGTVASAQAVSHDFGVINIEGGNVEHVFELQNTSSEPLEVRGAQTSCMCTTTTIETAEAISPVFGMHTSLDGYSEVVAPGESFQVRAVFDPLAHGPEGTGSIRRTVDVFTSAAPDGAVAEEDSRVPNGSVVSLTFTGEVVSVAAYEEMTPVAVEAQFDVEEGPFQFADIEHDFGVVLQSGGLVTHDFPFQYNGEGVVEIENVVGSCACTTGSVDRTSFASGDTGVLTVVFDPNLHEEPEGRFYKSVVLETAGDQADAEVKIWAEIDLDLGPEAYTLQGPHVD
ncbi:MAG: DUF1573 domain-containing protein [Candidatus Doudnabacteria bacterium]|nr:DUF1573 domain-containing protein [Candidatus Doudnabacteria bacterium]